MDVSIKFHDSATSLLGKEFQEPLGRWLCGHRTGRHAMLKSNITESHQ